MALCSKKLFGIKPEVKYGLVSAHFSPSLCASHSIPYLYVFGYSCTTQKRLPKSSIDKISSLIPQRFFSTNKNSIITMFFSSFFCSEFLVYACTKNISYRFGNKFKKKKYEGAQKSLHALSGSQKSSLNKYILFLGSLKQCVWSCMIVLCRISLHEVRGVWVF